MREIKFRVWDTINNHMHEVGCVLIDHASSAYSYPMQDDDPVASVGTADTNRVLMQYTGLKDSKGKEIYEGDIVRNDNGKHYSVIWHNFEGKYGFGNYTMLHAYTCEVIGNIYENPDLITK